MEERDATPDQRRITEVNAGLYAFDTATLREPLAHVGTDNAQGEKYLTDVIALCTPTGGRSGHPVADHGSWRASTTGSSWPRLGAELNRRIVERWMRAGVTVVDPATTWIDVDVTLGRDVTIQPHTQVLGASTIGDDVVVGPERP